MTLKIDKELLVSIVWGGQPLDYEVVQNEIVEHTRWSVVHECIIKHKPSGKYYDASYSEGATEMQDESPFEYDDVDENGCLELDEVEPYEVTVTKYKAVIK